MMKIPVFVRVLICGAFACLLLGLGAPLAAQAGKGSIKGLILKADGKPVDLAEITLEFLGEPKAKTEKTLTDKNGDWEKRNLAEGHWSISVRKLDKVELSAKVADVTVVAGKTTTAPDIAVKPTSEGGGGAVKTTSTVAEAKAEDAKAKANEEVKKLMAGVDASIASGAYDDALAALTTVAGQVEKCALCYAKMGEVNIKKGDQVAAEEAFKKAIELNPALSEAYSALSSLYNNQRKFEQAAAMSAKVNELAIAAGGTASPEALYNQGVAFWNADKAVEAEIAFKKATELDPKMSEAFFLLGMTQVNQNKLPDALKSFEAYLKLAPTGPNVETAKGLIAMIKKG